MRMTEAYVHGQMALPGVCQLVPLLDSWQTLVNLCLGIFRRYQVCCTFTSHSSPIKLTSLERKHLLHHEKMPCHSFHGGLDSMASRPHSPGFDEEVDFPWQECRPGNGWRFTGNLDDADGSLMVSRRPIMDTYCQYLHREMLETNDLASIRIEAEDAACRAYNQKGYNYVYHEEFEFTVDVYVWKELCECTHTTRSNAILLVALLADL